MISKILVAYDGTPCSDRALEFGVDLAEKYAASVTIVNVVELPVFGNPQDSLAVAASMSGFVKDLRKAHEGMLVRAKEKASKLNTNVAVSELLREGDPPAQIVSAASEGGFDLVVVGHGGEGRLREMLLGGVSEKIAHMARCAVVIIK